MKNRQFQYLKNHASQEDETWYGYKGHQVYFTHTSFVRLIRIQGEKIDAHSNLKKLNIGFFFADYGTDLNQSWYVHNQY